MTPSVSRRQFLQSTAVGAAAAWAAPVAALAAEPASNGFLIGVQSFSLRAYKTPEAIQHARDLGFDHIEFFSGQFSPNASAEEIATMKRQVQAAGLKMLGHGVNRFGKDAAANRKLFEFAKAAGIRNLTADPDPESFSQLDELVDEFDVRIAIHNHGPRHRYNRVVDVLKAIEGHDKRIGACADLGHYIRSGEESVEVIRLLGDRLYGVHLKDFAEMTDKTAGVILGRGHLDVDGVFQALKAARFPIDGCLSVEYEENKDNPIDDLRQCLAIARTAARKAAAS